jgi:drug/metabolite transporter (DMT)-like permease
MLGALLAVLSAATFAFNNAAARRGVITGTAVQGMAVTIPVGLLCFIPAALLTGAAALLPRLPASSIGWMACVGLLHFVVGRYCNYRANQAAGVNLTAPIIQLQVLVAVIQAVIILREPCTVLQVVGAVVMIGGALMTQRRAWRGPHTSAKDRHVLDASTFRPYQTAGIVFATLAALAYGTTPIMARTALAHTEAITGVVGGLIAYTAATAAMALTMGSRALRANVAALSRESLPWFLCSGVFVALAQGLFYSAVAIAPIMLVAPLMQLSLVFRFLFARALTPDHEVFGSAVIIGSLMSIAGACLVSIDSSVVIAASGLPPDVARLLATRL